MSVEKAKRVFDQFSVDTYKALETLNRYFQRKLDDSLNEFLNYVESSATHYFRDLKDVHLVRQRVGNWQKHLTMFADAMVPHLARDIHQLRDLTHKLTWYAAQKNYAQFMPEKPMHYKGYEEDYEIVKKVHAGYENLIYKLLQAAHNGALFADDYPQFLKRIRKVYPRRVVVKKEKPVLRKVKALTEAGSFGVTTPDAWKREVNQYMREYVPKFRSPDDVLQTDEGEEVRYAWEVERDATHEFMQAVRDPEIQVMMDQGVTDGVWIAILDQKTCEKCCAWRDGLTLTQIEEKLSTNAEYRDAAPDAEPPAHFNCATAGHDVITDKDIKKIENIEIGDKVLTHKNKYQKVLRTLQSLAQETMEIEFSNGVKIEITPEHPLFNGESFILAKDLKIGDLINVFRSIPKNDNSCIKDEEILSHETCKCAKEDHDV